MHNCKVDSYSAGARSLDNIRGKSLVFVEYVKRKRFRVIVDFLDNQINIVEFNNG